MKNRKNYLRARKKHFKWAQIGYFAENSVCPICGKDSLILIEKYDSWACMSCLEWLDPVCGDPRCPYCSLRPETPYDAYSVNNYDTKRWRCDNYQHKTGGMARHEVRRQRYALWNER